MKVSKCCIQSNHLTLNGSIMDNKGTDSKSLLDETLKSIFGYDSFRPEQDQIIKTFLSNKDCLAILPTGGGKSLCFQLPAIMREGLTLVVSPLIALMKDQVDQLTAIG